MATEIRQFTVTVTPANPYSNPLTVDLPLGLRNVNTIEIKVPSGPQGTVGFHLNISGTQVIPYEAGNYIIADNDLLSWDLKDLPQTGAWSVTLYDDGTYDHTLYFRFLLSPIIQKENDIEPIDFSDEGQKQ
jgi:hypothetical protein